MSTRREIIKLLGAAPVAGGAMVKSLAETMAGSEIVAVTAAMASAPVPSPGGPIEKMLGKTAYLHLKRLNEAYGSEVELKRMLRIDGLDPDIAALKSCSRAFQAAKQQERDVTAADLLRRARHLLWGG